MTIRMKFANDVEGRRVDRSSICKMTTCGNHRYLLGVIMLLVCTENIEFCRGDMTVCRYSEIGPQMELKFKLI